MDIPYYYEDLSSAEPYFAKSNLSKQTCQKHKIWRYDGIIWKLFDQELPSPFNIYTYPIQGVHYEPVVFQLLVAMQQQECISDQILILNAHVQLLHGNLMGLSAASWRCIPVLWYVYESIDN